MKVEKMKTHTTQTSSQLALFLKNPIYKNWGEFYNKIIGKFNNDFDGRSFPITRVNDSDIDTPRINLVSKDKTYQTIIGPQIIRMFFNCLDKEEKIFNDLYERLIQFFLEQGITEIKRIGVIKEFFTEEKGLEDTPTNFLKEKLLTIKKDIDSIQIKLSISGEYKKDIETYRNITILQGELLKTGEKKSTGLLSMYDINSKLKDNFSFSKGEILNFINWAMEKNTTDNLFSDLELNQLRNE